MFALMMMMTAAPGHITNALHRALQDRLGTPLTPSQEAQARLPVGLGGLGVLRAEDCAEAAFLGNVVSVRELVARLLRVTEVPLKEIEGTEEAFRAWTSKTGSDVHELEELPSISDLRTGEGKRHAQRVLSRPVHSRVIGRHVWPRAAPAASSVQTGCRGVVVRGAGPCTRAEV